jgi:hypothetical protein
MLTFGSLKATEATELYPFGTIASHNVMLLANLPLLKECIIASCSNDYISQFELLDLSASSYWASPEREINHQS